mmetsp:Transcript_120323/g.256853  ORF Transcript_120323/g.256853 Transcript_120323/m.256853 type:complete len:386 (+) Transcript_120323:741-1898(+)
MPSLWKRASTGFERRGGVSASSPGREDGDCGLCQHLRCNGGGVLSTTGAAGVKSGTWATGGGHGLCKHCRSVNRGDGGGIRSTTGATATAGTPLTVFWAACAAAGDGDDGGAGTTGCGPGLCRHCRVDGDEVPSITGAARAADNACELLSTTGAACSAGEAAAAAGAGGTGGVCATGGAGDTGDVGGGGMSGAGGNGGAGASGIEEDSGGRGPNGTEAGGIGVCRTGAGAGAVVRKASAGRGTTGLLQEEALVSVLLSTLPPALRLLRDAEHEIGAGDGDEARRFGLCGGTTTGVPDSCFRADAQQALPCCWQRSAAANAAFWRQPGGTGRLPRRRRGAAGADNADNTAAQASGRGHRNASSPATSAASLASAGTEEGRATQPGS